LKFAWVTIKMANSPELAIFIKNNNNYSEKHVFFNKYRIKNRI